MSHMIVQNKPIPNHYIEEINDLVSYYKSILDDINIDENKIIKLVNQKLQSEKEIINNILFTLRNSEVSYYNYKTVITFLNKVEDKINYLEKNYNL